MRVTPTWERLTAEIEKDTEAKGKLEWVREMYAFSLAVALEDVTLDTKLPPENQLVVQPPADEGFGKAAAAHYTWGPVFKKGDKEVWHFDKRDYTEMKHEEQMPRLKELPPFEEGWVLQDGKPVSRQLYDTLKLMIDTMNEAVEAWHAEHDGKGRR
jgi:hydroxyproline O-arabinosyltransferase